MTPHPKLFFSDLIFCKLSTYCFAIIVVLNGNVAFAQIPQQAVLADNLSNETVDVFVDQQTVWLRPTASIKESNSIQLPRLCAPVKSLTWVTNSEKFDSASKIELKPELTTWNISYDAVHAPNAVIQMELDAPAIILNQLKPVTAAADGSVLLHAYQATTHGEKLRFEPQSFKNTVGYWTVPTDFASWEFEVDQPGRYVIAVLQGCGTGQGGSNATVAIESNGKLHTELSFQIMETGHFQNFRWVEAGEAVLESPGTYKLTVKPLKIAKAALGDIRMIHLIKQAVK